MTLIKDEELNNEKVKKYLEKIRDCMIEDIHDFGVAAETIIFYEIKGGVKYFIDYDIATYEEPVEPTNTFEFDDEDIEYYNFYKEHKDNGLLVPGYANTIEADEKYEVVSLKQAFKIIINLLYKEASYCARIVFLNLLVQDISVKELAKLINVSYTFLENLLANKVDFTQDLKNQIAGALHFDVWEFEPEENESSYII